MDDQNQKSIAEANRLREAELKIAEAVAAEKEQQKYTEVKNDGWYNSYQKNASKAVWSVVKL